MLNKVSNLIVLIYWKIVCLISTIIFRSKAFIKGICIGDKIHCYGRVKIVKCTKSIMKIGENVTFRSMATSNLIGINRPCIISTLNSGAIVEIGDGCGFSGTVLGCFNKIILGKNVRCGANTLITDSDWHLDDPRSSTPRPVIIEDNVWLGVNVIVLKGVTIGENSVIGAGSIVTRNIPANVIAAGNPCKVISNI